MTIAGLLRQGRPTLSYELFPPRTPAAQESLRATMQVLAATAPDFISVTYGASGTTRDTSLGVVQMLAQHEGIPRLAHLTCVDQSRSDLIQVIERYLEDGVRDFLALRGDPPRGVVDWKPHPEGLLYANELVALVHEVARAQGIAELSVGVAAFPATHAMERWRQTTIDVMRYKQDAGATFAITQLFYDVRQYTDLVENARAQGVTMPIIPEVMPILSAKRALSVAELTGVPTPAELQASLDQAETDEDAREAGVAHASQLSRDLLDAGAPGIHVITFNQSSAALALVEAMGLADRPLP